MSSIGTITVLPGGATVPGQLAVPAAGSVRGPLVSCLMVTRGDRPAIAEAILCYRRQSYADRELVIVCDAVDTLVEPLLAELRDPSIRYHRVAPAVLGALRNLAAVRAAGALLCQWDDDDLYHPLRIELQVAALQATDAAASFVSRWLIWQPAARRLALGRSRLWEGSMLIRREAMLLYPPLARAEDTALVTALHASHALVGIEAPMAYLYVFDGRNSWGHDHFEALMMRASERFEGARHDELLARLRPLMPVDARAAHVR